MATAPDQFWGASERYENTGPLEQYARTRFLLKWVGVGKRVLELGCSTGYISRLLRGQQCRVVGVEQDASAASRACEFCERVVVVDLNEPNWYKDVAGCFDVILIGDVLEHLVHPDRLLRSLTVLLSPGGYLVISLPNVVHWRTRFKILAGKFDYQREGTLDCTHLRFFSLRSARALLETNGYEIRQFRGAVSGNGPRHIRMIFQWLSNVVPGLFAYQMLFQAVPGKAK
jgi:2-polyprenyl-3-methyl-5-hydroxy-6-metoxy-1,4-benzoquinol methylase